MKLNEWKYCKLKEELKTVYKCFGFEAGVITNQLLVTLLEQAQKEIKIQTVYEFCVFKVTLLQIN